MQQVKFRPIVTGNGQSMAEGFFTCLGEIRCNRDRVSEECLPSLQPVTCDPLRY